MQPEDLPVEDDVWEQTPAAVQVIVAQLWSQVQRQEVEISHLHKLLDNQKPDTGKKRVLIIDDSLLVRRTVATIVKKHGHQVVEASDGDQLLKEAREHHPDLIIIDVNMKRKSGIEALEELRQDEELKDVPVVMLTSETDRKTVRTALSYQVLGYLIKDREVMEERLLEYLSE